MAKALLFLFLQPDQIYLDELGGAPGWMALPDTGATWAAYRPRKKEATNRNSTITTDVPFAFLKSMEFYSFFVLLHIYWHPGAFMQDSQ